MKKLIENILLNVVPIISVIMMIVFWTTLCFLIIKQYIHEKTRSN